MRIALAVERFDRASGGQAIWAQGFASHLCSCGHEVHVVACDVGDHGLPVHTHQVPWSWSPLKRAKLFHTALSRLNPDLVHDSGVAVWRGVFQPQTGSGLHSLDRLIATDPPARRLRAALSPKMRLLRFQMHRLEDRQAERARCIVAVSPLVKQLLVSRHRLASHKIIVVPNGIDTERYHVEDPALRQRTRQQLGVGDVPLFLAAAHNFALKGLDVSLSALALLAGAGHGARLAVAGADPGPKWLRLVDELNLGSRVVFCGHVADMRGLFAAADAFLHPTRWDACSLVLLEALASGLPVVTSRENGAADAVLHGRNGYILDDPNACAALAGYMILLLDPIRRGVLGKEARKAALQRDVVENYRTVERLAVSHSSL